MSLQQIPMLVTIYGLAGVLAAILAYVLASARRRDASFWATLSFLLPPMALLTFFLTTVPIEHHHVRMVERKLQKYLDPDY